MINQSNKTYDVETGTIYPTEVLKSNICDYNDAYILVRDDIITTAHNHATSVAFKNSAHFIKCIIKIDETPIDDAKDRCTIS